MRSAVMGMAKWRALRRRRRTDHTHAFVPGTTPTIKRSTTHETGDGIYVVFDRPMSHTASMKDAITVIDNGRPPMHPDKVLFTPDNTAMALLFDLHTFHYQDVITWTYDDTNATEELKGAEVSGKELSGTQNSVANKLKNVPLARKSEIYPNNGLRIVVMWDRKMQATADIRFSIYITIDGAQPILPEEVLFSESGGQHYMTLTSVSPYLAGQVISWRYDNGTNERLSSVVGDIEAEDHVHEVDNKLADPAVIVEDEPFDIIVGTAGGDNGFSDDLGFGSLPIDVEIDGYPLTTLYVDHSNRLLFMDYAGMLAPWNASSIKITLGTTGQEVELLWDAGLKMYSVESVAAMNYFTVNDGTALGFIIHSPDGGDDILDLDGDGNPDTVIYDDNGILITEDADSFDIDLDGDGIADISIHK